MILGVLFGSRSAGLVVWKSPKPPALPSGSVFRMTGRSSVDELKSRSDMLFSFLKNSFRKTTTTEPHGFMAVKQRQITATRCDRAPMLRRMQRENSGIQVLYGFFVDSS